MAPPPNGIDPGRNGRATPPNGIHPAPNGRAGPAKGRHPAPNGRVTLPNGMDPGGNGRAGSADGIDPAANGRATLGGGIPPGALGMACGARAVDHRGSEVQRWEPQSQREWLHRVPSSSLRLGGPSLSTVSARATRSDYSGFFFSSWMISSQCLRRRYSAMPAC
jgi:hypothetical protein